MTLHARQGAGVSCGLPRGPGGQGLFPSLPLPGGIPSALEEERLATWGITRAKGALFLFPRQPKRRLLGRAFARAGGCRRCCSRKLPPELIPGDIPQSGGASIRREQRAGIASLRVDREDSNGLGPPWQPRKPRPFAVRRALRRPGPGRWAINAPRQLRATPITHLFGAGEKDLDRVVKFEGMGPKDPSDRAWHD